MAVKQEPITRDELNVLAVTCAQLDRQPKKVSTFLLGEPYIYAAHYSDLRDGVIFWSYAYGWRLHTDWRRALEAKRAAMAGTAVAERTPSNL